MRTTLKWVTDHSVPPSGALDITDGHDIDLMDLLGVDASQGLLIRDHFIRVDTPDLDFNYDLKVVTRGEHKRAFHVAQLLRGQLDAFTEGLITLNAGEGLRLHLVRRGDSGRDWSPFRRVEVILGFVFERVSSGWDEDPLSLERFVTL